MDECIYLQASYYQRISQILNDKTIPLYICDHYSESPNWKLNNDVKNMVDTFVWLSYSDEEKKTKLDEELDDYMIL